MRGSIGLSFIFLTAVISITAQNFDDLKAGHNAKELSKSEIQYLANLQDLIQFDEDLRNILVPRVVGTKGHKDVQNYIITTLKNLDYNIEIDEFVDKTPFGNATFKNIIATLDPTAERYLVVAAHYDSKYFEDGEFLGATDSAVPCAMMLQMARIFKSLDFPTKNDVSLKLIFFDGEEAFVQWGPKDSIYGARHLAAKFEKSKSRSKLTGERVSDLQRIDCLMLLDLLGHANPTIYNYFPDTRSWFNLLSGIERKLYRLRLLKRRNSKPFFINNSRSAFIEDDHIPFLRRGVPIMHLIPIPFPDAWHTLRDNEDILDPDSIHDLNLTIQLFVAQYLHISLVPEIHMEL
ncbi:glutaminyl-peptide cyclotransferase-like isoform X2 [Coccinella septempunctata]|uniref:glutaminyl-peptide cyclotransferase-like isoform X2 n=1 Tax=Coccinella septempunctata TaxID=41139 RepID=UPI001D07AB2F|nr:glutaminyl-peptide cyclotransferase-like isoform X2 [Coccinella septempunctata]